MVLVFFFGSSHWRKGETCSVLGGTIAVWQDGLQYSGHVMQSRTGLPCCGMCLWEVRLWAAWDWSQRNGRPVGTALLLQERQIEQPGLEMCDPRVESGLCFSRWLVCRAWEEERSYSDMLHATDETTAMWKAGRLKIICSVSLFRSVGNALPNSISNVF